MWTFVRRSLIGVLTVALAAILSNVLSLSVGATTSAAPGTCPECYDSNCSDMGGRRDGLPTNTTLCINLDRDPQKHCALVPTYRVIQYENTPNEGTCFDWACKKGTPTPTKCPLTIAEDPEPSPSPAPSADPAD